MTLRITNHAYAIGVFAVIGGPFPSSSAGLTGPLGEQARAISASDLTQLGGEAQQPMSWRRREAMPSGLRRDTGSSSAPPQHINASSKAFLAQRLATAAPAPQQDTMLEALAGSIQPEEELPLQVRLAFKVSGCISPRMPLGGVQSCTLAAA